MTEPIPMPAFPADPSTASVFSALADVVYGGDDFARVHDAVVEAAPRLVRGCDHASLMLARGDGFLTAAATDDIAREVDLLEQELREGPCVDAIADEPTYIASDLAGPSPWPRLAERVLTETPVRGMAGFRLVVGERRTGALNLFSDRPGALDEDSLHEGMVLASFVSVALVAAEDRQTAATLREGLASNREIGKAVGLMMAFHKIDDEQAFAMLRKASQDMNIKVTEVARQVVEHHNKR